jgi:hypothetical protein
MVIIYLIMFQQRLTDGERRHVPDMGYVRCRTSEWFLLVLMMVSTT